MKKSDQYLKLVEWSDEDQCYIGRIPSLTLGGIHGDDEKKVYSELCELADELIADYEEEGEPLPSPTAGKPYSGKFNLRVGEELHEQLALESFRVSESLNTYCLKALKDKVRS